MRGACPHVHPSPSLNSLCYDHVLVQCVQEELSKDLRATLESESKRADAAELALGEARARLVKQERELSEARDQLAAAAAQLAALETALEEKMKQVQGRGSWGGAEGWRNTR